MAEPQSRRGADPRLVTMTGKKLTKYSGLGRMSLLITGYGLGGPQPGGHAYTDEALRGSPMSLRAQHDAGETNREAATMAGICGIG
jgi:hypothetical protein